LDASRPSSRTNRTRRASAARAPLVFTRPFSRVALLYIHVGGLRMSLIPLEVVPSLKRFLEGRNFLEVRRPLAYGSLC